MMMNVNVTSNKFNEIKHNFQYENKKKRYPNYATLDRTEDIQWSILVVFFSCCEIENCFCFRQIGWSCFETCTILMLRVFIKLFDYDYEIITFIFRVSGLELRPGHVFLLRFKKNPEVILIYIFTSGLIIYFLVCCRFYFSAVVHVFLVCCSFTFGLFFIHFSNFIFIHILYIH